MLRTMPGLPVYFENSAGRILEHPDGYVLFEYQAGKRKLSDFQALLTHTSLLLKRHNWHKILGDQRLMTPFTDEETAWVVDFWLAKENVRPGGLLAAIILANDVFARLAANQMVAVNQSATLTYRLFDNKEKAAAWLAQQP